MNNVRNLNDYRECELLGSFNVHRQPDGSILIGMTYMAPKQIEAHNTIRERFYKAAQWLRDGVGTLEEQGDHLITLEDTE